LVGLSLEPIGAPKSARKILERAANSLALEAQGIVFDKQADTIATPRGVKRFVAEPRTERFSLIELGWWFLGSDILERERLDDLLRVFDKYLPLLRPQTFARHLFATATPR
jgi:hypothetical protein